MSYEIITGNAAIQKSPEWLELRRKYITASEVPIIMGRSPYRTLQELVYEKTTGTMEVLSQDKIDLFKKADDIEIKARESLIGDGYNFEPQVILSKTVPDLLASLDGFDQNHNTILEVKYIGRAKLIKLEQDKNLPVHHYIQIQAQLLASGAKRCLYYASDSKNIFLKNIEPDLEFFETIKKEIKKVSQNLKDIREAQKGVLLDPIIVNKELEVSKEVITSNQNTNSAKGLFTEAQKHLLKTQICPGASDDQLSLFQAICEKTNLDPFTRQIYGIVRQGKLSIQTSIDGFRLIAARTLEYEGQSGPFWCGEDAVWRDVWLAKTPPSASKVGVFRKGFKEPIWAIARFDAYAQSYQGKLSNMWQKFSDLMIGKCAEALALRRAFPNELSGLYTSDEMGQTTNTEPIKEIIPKAALQAPKTDLENDFDAYVESFDKLEKNKI